MIDIIDYGMGNLRSVQKGFEKLGYGARVVDQPADLSPDPWIVLPGVGAFDEAVKNLREAGFWDPVMSHLRSDRPFLGICLGLQLLFEGSEEGERKGFGLFPGTVRKFEDISPVPHMGWNEVQWVGPGEVLRPEDVDTPCYYFVHSYFPVPDRHSVVAGETEYGGEFCSAVREGNVVGVQFHPEKSQRAGLCLLRRLADRFLSR